MTIPENRLSALDQVRAGLDVCLFSSAQKYTIPPEYGTKTVGSGAVTHVPLEEGVRAAVTAASGDRAAFRTNAYFHADSLRAIQAIYHSDAGETNQVRRWGLFHENDGVYFELSGTTVAVGWRSKVSGSPVDTNIVQAAWNADALQGNGAFVLDVTKANLYEIALHRSTGEVRFFVNGILVHTLEKRNVLAVPFMRTTRLPIGVDIINSGASGGGSITCLYQGVWDESGQPPQAVNFGKSASATLSDTGVPILSIRPKATFATITNRSLIIPRKAVLGASAVGAVRLVLNGTLSGAVWADVDATYSGAEYDITASSISGGQVVGEYRVPANEHLVISLDDVFRRAGRKLSLKAFPNSDQDVLSIVGVSDTGTPTGYASVVWDEIR